jgi:Ca2+-binding RTX toxin-like protein
MPSITINNSSFETDAVNDGDRLEDSVTGWDLTANDVNDTGVYDPEAGDVSGVTGGQVAFLDGPTSTMSQQLTHTYSVTEQYTFTVDLGSEDGKGGGPTTYDVNIYAGGTLIGTTSGSTLGNATLSTVNVTSTLVDPSLTGLPLTIEIVQDGDNELLIDNVTGEYTLRPADGIVQGTSGADVFDVGDADVQGDLVDGADGLNDTIYTFQGEDDVKSGAGNDQIFLGSGDDKADGEDGNDIIYGQSGEDDLKGGLGDDVIYGDYAPDDDRGTLAE